VLIQNVLRGLTGQARNELAVVASTLAIATLFNPMRHSIQGFIDRRFYRRKYNASRTIAEFGSALRQEVDLDEITARVVGVVTETMQPTHVSLWLRKSPRKR
jgi:hypothetical protein